jgi:uncharacterized protein YukE
MFRRWLQENDFKYLDKHYGINQITSYASIAYEDLKTTLTDKQMVSAETRAIISERKEYEGQLKRLLHKEHNRDNRVARARALLGVVEKKIEAVASDPASTPGDPAEQAAMSKERSRLKALLTRQSRQNFLEQKNQLDQSIEALNTKLAGCQKDVSKLDYLIEQGYERIDVNKKRVMDSIKILARNLFYRALAPFKELYDNYRETTTNISEA